MKAVSILLCTLLAAAPVLAEGPRRLDRSGRICDSEGVFCIKGTLWYRPNSRRLELHGRVSKAPGPGWVSIVFRGSSRRNQPASAIMEFPVRGSYSEIVDRAFIPDHPQVDHWRVERLIFEPDRDAARASRDRD